jgi:hypothetical protein
MTALLRTNLGNIQYVPLTAGSILTNPAATKSLIRGIVLFNGNTTVETVSLYNVPNSALALGTAGVSNIFFTKGLAANETFFLDFAYPITLIGTNDSIQASTTTASKVTVMLTGDQDA